MDGSSAPFGSWSVKSISVLTPYFDGTDTNSGAACNNDIALLWMNPLNNIQIGAKVGWFALGWNNYGYTTTSTAWNLPTSPTSVVTTAFGYPSNYDGANRKQISHATTYVMQSSDTNLKVNIR